MSAPQVRADSFDFSEFMNRAAKGIVYQSASKQRVILDIYKSKEACEDFADGANWNARLQRCEIKAQKTIEIFTQENGKFYIQLTNGIGCETYETLELLPESNVLAQISQKSSSILNIQIQSLDQIVVEDLGYGELECGETLEIEKPKSAAKVVNFSGSFKAINI
jgi:hypothetical protein